MVIREFTENDILKMNQIWNQVVEAGVAIPQRETLDFEKGAAFYGSQSFTGVAEEDGEIAGLYILHPNNVGRCGHIANASYAVDGSMRGKGIGEALVSHSLKKAKEKGFRILQFNAVVKTNETAIRLYEKLGFVRLGVIPGGFMMKDGAYEDIIPFYHLL